VHPRSPIRRLAVAAVALTSSALALTGCGGGDSSTGTSGGGNAAGAASSTPLPSVAADQALAGRVPAAIKDDGVISVGSDTTYAPSEFIAEDGTTIVGFDVDLFTVVAEKLGLKAQFQTAPFDSIIAGVGSQKYEVGVSSFTINPDRLAQANMISYYSAGTQWATKAGNPKKVDPDNACGLSIGVQKGTVQIDDLTARSKKCTDAGKPAIKQVIDADQSKVTASVVSGKTDAMLADSPVGLYAVKQTGGQLEALGDIYDAAPYGFVVPKDETDFAQAIADALKAMAADGSYKAALDKWGNDSGAISDFAVNP
jgi:polar amino acid transport system substrate-binding protein